MRWCSVVAVLAACSFEHGAAISSDASMTVTDADATTLLLDADNCYSAGNVAFCLVAPPSGMDTLTGDVDIDTDATVTSGLGCRALAPGSANVCVVAETSITVPNGRTLSAHGTRPLVLLASQMTIAGVIDIASHIGGRIGPNADRAGCNGGADPTPDGGGQGGSFGSKGGDGGGTDDAPSSGGAAGGMISTVPFRGGCPGARGGGTGGLGGHGGGALMLKGDQLMLVGTAKINASGGSGEGAAVGKSGGGGGGSGGTIVLAVTQIAKDPGVQIFANGGHGGGGSSSSTAGSGGNDTTQASSGGTGGTAGGSGGAGAPGFPSTTRNGPPGTNNGDGGGGGGGGAGTIHVISTSQLTGSNVSPAPT